MTASPAREVPASRHSSSQISAAVLRLIAPRLGRFLALAGAACTVFRGVLIQAASPEGLLAYEPFEYAPSGAPIVGKTGGQGFANAWVAGISGTPSGSSLVAGSSNLVYSGLATLGVRMRQNGSGRQAMQRNLSLPLGADSTVRYASLLVRPDNNPQAAHWFGLLLMGGNGINLFAGKPGGGQSMRYAIEDAGGARQVPTSRTVAASVTTLLVLKVEFRAGADRISLFVNPPIGTEPATADAVKADLDLGTVTTVALNASTLWSADELRIGTTFASVLPKGAEFALAAVAPQNGSEHTPLSLRLTTAQAPPAGRTLTFELVGETFGATVDAATGDFTWTPGELDGGETRRFTVRATSNATPPESSAVSFNVTVGEQNSVPRLADPGSQTAEEGAPLSFQLTATDADVPPQQLVFSRVAGPEELTVSESGLIQWVPTPAHLDRIFDVTVQVRDASGGRDARTFSITTRSSDGGGAGGPPPRLLATQTGDAVTLLWEDIAGTFVLQAATDLNPTAWRDLAVAPVLNAGFHRVTRPATNVTEFFRLTGRGGVTRLTGATPRAERLGPGATLFVELNLSGPPAAGDVLEVTETTAGLSHTRRVPAEFLAQPDGSLGFFLNGDDAPFGTPRVVARLVSATGAGRGLVTFDIPNLPLDTGGQPPSLGFLVWSPPVGAARRPGNDLATIRPLLYIGLNDPDGDLVRVELTLIDPEGTAIHRIVPITQTDAGQLDLLLHPLAFHRESLTGSWEARVTAFDRTGSSTGPRIARLNFGDNVPFNAAQAPLLHHIAPQLGVPGDVVELSVLNVTDLSTTNTIVRIGGRSARVLEIADGALRVVVPTGTDGGLVDVAVPQGTSIGPTNFVVLSAPNVEPAIAHALAGQALQFRLDRRLSERAVVAWSVNGGGSIDANGLFRAPNHLSQPGEVTVRADITLPGGTSTATASVTVEAAPIARGSDFLTAATGGVVWSRNLLARAEVPPGALADNTTLSVSVPAQDARPAPPAGSELLGLIELAPDGARFSTTVGVIVPLTRSLPPGESLPLQRWNPATGAWVNEGIFAVVEPDGQSARAEVSHFSLHGLIGPTAALSPKLRGGLVRHDAGSVPRITAVTPSFLLEGDLRPFYLEGSNLDGPAEVAVVREDGSLMPGFMLGPLVRLRDGAGVEDGTRAAFLLDCPVLPTLGARQNLALQIRVRKPDLADALFPLQLRGLPEFSFRDFDGFRVTERTFSRLYSEIELSLILQPQFDVTDLSATHGIRIVGELDVTGRYGPSATGDESGFAPLSSAFRRGGQGGNLLGENAGFRAVYEFPAGHQRVGHGGLTGWDVDSFDILFALADCQGDGARRCFEEILEDLREDPFDELEDAPSDLFNLLQSLPDGRRGASGMWNGAPTHWFQLPSGTVSDNLHWVRGFGPGSGGGGGGKSGALFGDRSARFGGGAGGEGGAAVRLVSGRSLALAGRVLADGGNGGHGADGGLVSGGGGGGGGAGAIRLLAGESVAIGAGGRTSARGGLPGWGGIATRRENIGFGLAAELPYDDSGTNTPLGMNVIEGALFDETRLANSVVTRGVIPLVPRRAPEFFTFDGRPGLALDPNRPNILVRRAGGSESRRCFFHPIPNPTRPTRPDLRVNLILFPGVNEIVLGDTGEELLNRHVVFLSGPDTDGDQISDADELALGTDPATADTDSDGLVDLEELVNGSNPRSADTDGDLLPDNVELALGTLPTNPDSDGDSLWDSLEVYRSQPPTEGRSSAFSYTEGELFAVVNNDLGDKLLALLDPVTGRLGALGPLPRNIGDGITFDPRGTLYLAQGDELFAWAGSVPAPHGTPAVGPFHAVASGGPGSSGGGVVGFAPGLIPPTPPGAGNSVRDFRTLVNEDGTLKFNKLGNLRSPSALGAFTLPVPAGPLTYDPFPLQGNRISGVLTLPGVTGQTFHLDFTNPVEPPLVRVFTPTLQAPQPIKGLSFHRPTGKFALLGGGASDVLQEIDPYAGGVVGHGYTLGRTDATALIHVDTNRFHVTTGSREVLAVELQPAVPAQNVSVLSRTVAPVSRLARVPCVGGCFSPNIVTGTGPIGPSFFAQGFVTADINADGRIDLAVAGNDGLEAVVHILHGDGTGRFTAVKRHVLGEGQIGAQGRVVSANLNGDAHPDLLVAWNVSTFFGVTGHLATLAGTANGHFAAPTDDVIMPSAEGFAAGQFDGAIHDDVVFANGNAFFVPTDAGGALNLAGRRQLLRENFDTSLVEFADLDGDGRKDLIRLGEILSTHAPNAFTAGFNRASETSGYDVMELGDHDGDGKLDLFVSGYSGFVRIFPGNGDRTFDPSFQAFNGRMAGSIPQFAVADLDGDGPSEIVMPEPSTRRVLVLAWRPANGRYEIVHETPLTIRAFAARAADTNGDGLLDLVLLGEDGAVEVVPGR